MSVISNKGTFQNYGTVTITNSLAQKYGIYCSSAGASFSNSGTINITNTAGVGVRFDKTAGGSISNSGSITITGIYSGVPNVESAAIANQVTLNNDQGTITAPTGNASIYNSGTICGGTYTGAQPSTNAWKANCT